MGQEGKIEDRSGGKRTVVRTDDAEGGSLMSRCVPRTLRTLKLDYREIAALLLAPSRPSDPSAGCSPSYSDADSEGSVLLRPPPTSIHLRYVVPRVLPLVHIACIATDG